VVATHFFLTARVRTSLLSIAPHLNKEDDQGRTSTEESRFIPASNNICCISQILRLHLVSSLQRIKESKNTTFSSFQSFIIIMCGENARKRTLRSSRWISMVVFAAIIVDMDRSLAFSPVTDVHSGGAERRRTNSRIGFTSDESSRGNTDLNVAMSPPMNLQFSPASSKNDNQQAPNKLTRSTNELVSLPSSSRAVSLGKRNRNSKMIRPKSLHSSARVQAIPENSDLLTREEEQNLTLHIRRLRQGARIRNELVIQIARQPAETEWAEACGLSVMELRRVMCEGQEARSMLVSANAGLVTSIAKRHYHAVKQSTEFGGGLGTILTMQDMIQEGNLGLMQAAERFEPERGLRFSTYATYWVRQRIFRSITNSSRTIRLPAHGEYLIVPLVDYFSCPESTTCSLSFLDFRSLLLQSTPH
jgi:hypothetical protein